MTPQPVPLAVIGGGTMAQALVRGAMDHGALDPARLAVAEPDAGKRGLWKSWGVVAFGRAGDAIEWLRAAEAQARSTAQPPSDQSAARSSAAGQVLVAVKPQVLSEVARELGPAIASAGVRRVVISILAGTPTARVRAALGGHAAIVRAMPNLAVRHGKGMTAVCLGEGAAAGDESLAEAMFRAVGAVARIDEPLMDAFTAVAGSGPAYVFYLAEALAIAATDAGFDEAAALPIVRAVIAGAGAMIESSDQAPAALRAAVTSKGGTTAAATAVLDAEHVRDIIRRAVLAARDRGRELSRGE